MPRPAVTVAQILEQEANWESQRAQLVEAIEATKLRIAELEAMPVPSGELESLQAEYKRLAEQLALVEGQIRVKQFEAQTRQHQLERAKDRLAALEEQLRIHELPAPVES
jgi:DNA repair ATPase RecN